jgi:histidyl-tRNA synthetase
MALNKQPYRGTRDFFPKDKRVRDYLFTVMTKTAESFGYESYDGPLLEEVDLYKAKSGEELVNEQIYSFTDRGERFVAIRPEMTPTLARMVAQVHRESTKPLRWFSIPNLMRYEKPQRGRVREHWQLNCDVFGSPGRLGEVEILQVAVELLQSYGANSSHFEILVNDRAIVDAIFKTMMKSSDDQTHRLYKIVDKAKKLLPKH